MSIGLVRADRIPISGPIGSQQAFDCETANRASTLRRKSERLEARDHRDTVKGPVVPQPGEMHPQRLHRMVLGGLVADAIAPARESFRATGPGKRGSTPGDGRCR